MNKKTILITLTLVIIVAAAAGGGYWWYEKNIKTDSTTEEAVLTPRAELEEQSPETVTEKTEPETKVTTPAVEVKVPIEAATLTASLMKNAVTIGSNSYPANSVILLFYPGPGKYNVQKNVTGTWETTVTTTYSGSGGLNGGYLKAEEDNVQLRLQKVESGKVTAESKVFVVKRVDLALGIKTYN